MSRPAALAALVCCLTACTRSLEGDWYGTCSFADDTYGYSGTVRVNVEDGGGQRLEGRTRVDMYDATTFAGDMEGLRSDRYVRMEAAVTSDDNEPWRFDIEGELQDDGSIEANCALRHPDEPGAGLTGDIILEQP